ncbi:hypothetical protein G436_0216 [Leptospira interrogans serovar Hardjo str. Norma]|uniref:Uncharacterized protein n=1 Tax=Leptospira interrogans serovar Hardjo str. Norma TaxID=1279460 RepID=A0A0M4MQT3_LEPIR|nr:hypothetical protein G436_0216 [Leptospira interrogans serovar Hardjo str. Norma]
MFKLLKPLPFKEKYEKKKRWLFRFTRRVYCTAVTIYLVESENF